MFGESLLVAPVLHDSEISFYIPAGVWTCYWSGETISGPQWVHHEHVPLDHIPVYVRPNTAILLGPVTVETPDYDYCSVGLELRTFQLTQEVAVSVPAGKGCRLGGTIRVGPAGVIDSDGVHLAQDLGDQTSPTA